MVPRTEDVLGDHRIAGVGILFPMLDRRRRGSGSTLLPPHPSHAEGQLPPTHVALDVEEHFFHVQAA